MAEVLTLEHVSLKPSGATVSLSISGGQSLAVVGPAASGKSHLLEIITGAEKAPRGKVRRPKTISSAGSDIVSRRLKPQTLARRGRGEGNAGFVTEVLSGLCLWNFRQRSMGELSDSQQIACELIQPLVSGASLLVLDGHLDQLDPWALQGAFQLLARRQAEGAAVVVATNRPELAARFDAIVFLRDSEILYAGTPEGLIRSVSATLLEVASDNHPGARALAEPFEVDIEETANGLVYRAAEGQELAARLLLEGYGDIKFVIVRQPTVEQAMLEFDVPRKG